MHKSKPRLEENGMDKILEPIRVMYFRANGGTAGAKEAFDILESRIPSRRGRRFYGVFFPETAEYRACVQKVVGEDAKSMRLEDWTIPGGKYLTKTIYDWSSKLPELPQIFMEMAKGRMVDTNRPSIEYYRSMKELVLYFPVVDST